MVPSLSFGIPTEDIIFVSITSEAHEAAQRADCTH